MDCPAKNIQVWETTYEDCQQPWTFCRCKDSTVTQHEMVEEFGRIPVALRENVVNVMAGPAGALASSAHVGPGTDITFQGPKASMSPLLVMVSSIRLFDMYYILSQAPEKIHFVEVTRERSHIKTFSREIRTL